MKLSKTQNKILEVLRELAKKPGICIGYQALCAKACPAINVGDVIQRNTLSTWLGEILEHELAEGRPAICVLVVRESEGMPGKGFFTMLEKLGRAKPKEPKLDVFIRELKLVNDYYAVKS